MADRLATDRLSGANAATTIGRRPPATPVPASGADAPLLCASHWTVVLALAGAMFAGAELLLRTDLVWQLPAKYLLQDENDRDTWATWLVHHPPATRSHIIVLGSSPAAAIIDLPHKEVQEALQTALSQPSLQLFPLTVVQGCYAEQLTLLENAFAYGHQPQAVLVFSWPSCLGPGEDTDALLARRMPLVSELLADLEGRQRPLDVRLHAMFVRASAVHRHRHIVNAWLRNQWRNLLRGQTPLAPVTFAGRPRITQWSGDLRLDRQRYERLGAISKGLAETGPGARQLAAILDLARQKHVPVLVVESPWAPPLFDVLGAKGDDYFHAMQVLAARGGASYVDPNRSARLSAEHFNDLFHVNQRGARAYLPSVASALRQFAQAW